MPAVCDAVLLPQGNAFAAMEGAFRCTFCPPSVLLGSFSPAFLNEKSQTTAVQAAAARDGCDTSPLVDSNSPSCIRKPGLSPLLQLDPASPSRWTQSSPTSTAAP